MPIRIEETNSGRSVAKMQFDTLGEIVLTFLPIVISCAAFVLSIFALKQKVKERRIKHAEALRSASLNLIRTAATEPRITDQAIFSFNESTRDLLIYFSKPVRHLINQLYSNSCRLKLVQHRIDNSRSSDEDRNKALAELDLLEEWFESQINEVDHVLKRYL